MSANLGFDEAFANAVANLPPTAPPHPDALTTVIVNEITGLFGGIAGLPAPRRPGWRNLN